MALKGAMRLTFLGTSAGMPSRHRNVTGLALAIDDSKDWYLVDCGEATQHQLLHTPYSAARLRAIFITHIHGDHCFGLPGLLASANMGGRTEPLNIFCPRGIQQFVEAAFANSDAHMRYDINFIPTDVGSFHWEDKHVKVEATALSHRVPCFAYRFEEKPPSAIDTEKLTQLGVPRGPLWSQLQNGNDIELDDGRLICAKDVRFARYEPRSVIVAGDNDKPELLHDAMTRSDVLVHEATFGHDIYLQNEGRYQHSSAQMVAQAAAKANLQHLVLTHFSQRYAPAGSEHPSSVSTLEEEARRFYTGHLSLAEDFASFQLDRDKSLQALSGH